ncbi:phosphopantetheine-binding protein [Streptomyces sp. NPDC055210]
MTGGTPQTAGASQTESTPPAPPAPQESRAASALPGTREELRGVLARTIGLPADRIDDRHNLVELGLGSLELMRLITRWRRQGLHLDYGELSAEPTVDGWWRFFAARTDPESS